jgi:hypothetical protein
MIVRSVGVGRGWDCILCTCVNEEGGDGEGVDSEGTSLLSYTVRYVCLVELDDVCQVGFRALLIPFHTHCPVGVGYRLPGRVPRTDKPVYMCDGEGAGSEASSLLISFHTHCPVVSCGVHLEQDCTKQY